MRSALAHSAVSQRDMQRVFRLFKFFVSHHVHRRLELSTDQMLQSLLLAIAVAYYFRLPFSQKVGTVISVAC